MLTPFQNLALSVLRWVCPILAMGAFFYADVMGYFFLVKLFTEKECDGKLLSLCIWGLLAALTLFLAKGIADAIRRHSSNNDT